MTNAEQLRELAPRLSNEDRRTVVNAASEMESLENEIAELVALIHEIGGEVKEALAALGTVDPDPQSEWKAEVKKNDVNL